MPADERIRAVTAAHTLVVFSSSWCPYCQQVQKALKRAKIKAHVVEVDAELRRGERASFERACFCRPCHLLNRASLKWFTVLRKPPALTNTMGRYELQPPLVPSVWIGDKYIGGCNDGPERWMGTIPNLTNGKLQGWLKALEKERNSVRGRKRAKYQAAKAAESSKKAAPSPAARAADAKATAAVVRRQSSGAKAAVITIRVRRRRRGAVDLKRKRA